MPYVAALKTVVKHHSFSRQSLRSAASEGKEISLSRILAVITIEYSCRSVLLVQWQKMSNIVLISFIQVVVFHFSFMLIIEL